MPISTSPFHSNESYAYEFPGEEASMYENDISQEKGTKQAKECPKTYTVLESAGCCTTEYQTTVLSSDMETCSQATDTDDIDLLSWTKKHPQHWSTREVLDWLYYFAEHSRVDFLKFRGEAFQDLTGPDMCSMTVEDYVLLEPGYGSDIFAMFSKLRQEAEFSKPAYMENGNYPGCGSAVSIPVPTSTDPISCYSTESMDSNIEGYNEMLYEPDLSGMTKFLPFDQTTTVSIDGHCYDFDPDDIMFPEVNEHSFQEVKIHTFHSSNSDDGYVTESDRESDRMPLPALQQKKDAILEKPVRKPGRPRKSLSSVSTDDGSEEYKPSCRGRPKGQSTTKGNHLWEFVRDLLKDSRYNPKLIRWEDEKDGVFRFVQSEAVASMWGKKKNNPQMTYEKLSRAMRFSRTAGYFADVPKNGKFPKKLCFKFGARAFGWQ